MEAIEFKFRILDAKGRAKVGLRRRARYDGRLLTLGKEELPATSLKAVATEQGRLVLLVEAQPGMPEARAYEINPKILVETVRRFNRALSARDAEGHRESLAARGRAAEFRTETCPQCRCTVDLSGLPRTAQAFCPYCDVLWSLDEDNPPEESTFRVCEHCGYFAQPRPFTTAYILFAVMFVAWQTHKSVRCHNCMRREAWRMLAFNAVTLIGVPMALLQLVRAYVGGTRRSMRLDDLDRANRLAQRGRVDEADHIYDRIEQRLGVCAGVRFSHGMSYFKRGPDRYEEAATQFLVSLGDCANYPFAFQAIQQCYQVLGRNDELQQLLEVWDVAESGPPGPVAWPGERAA
jgi:hypothetical protein